jgi:mono/diheme cytochrome c family protein
LTEIPEHLLKRSRERRAALGLPTDGGEGTPAEGGVAEGSASVPAAVAPSSPAAAPAAAAPAGRAKPSTPPAVPPPRPDPPYVAAAKARPKIPWWAMPVVGLLPLWVLLYAWALKPTEKVVAGPLGEGKTVFATCASCHGSTGGGGVGRQLSNGEVLKTFPKFEDQASLVYTGSAPYSGKIYGDPNRPGGPHQGGSFNGSFMPQQGSKYGGALTDAEIIAVVCHERFTISGANPLDPKYVQEFADWCAPGAPKFEAVSAGDKTLDEEGISTTPKA